MKKEIIVTCLLCGTTGFTARGLRSHWCEAKGPSKNSRHSTPLTAEEWESAVYYSTHGPFAMNIPSFPEGSHHTQNADEQRSAVKHLPIGHLKLVIASEQTKPSVKKAAESRLRRLEKERAK